jgi:hypothetical protein
MRYLKRLSAFVILFSGLVASNLDVGCQVEQASVPEAQGPDWSVVTGLARDAATVLEVGTYRVSYEGAHLAPGSLSVSLDVLEPPLGSRRLVFSVWSFGAFAGFGASVRDAHGRLLWDMSWETDEQNLRVTESAGSAFLEIQRTPEPAGGYTERYDLYIGADHRVGIFRYGGNEGTEVVDEVRAFARFWPKGTELDNNPDGLLLARLMTSRVFVLTVARDLLGQDEVPDSWLDVVGSHPRSLFERYCDAADICTLLKCLYGGGASNGLCNFCAGSSVACKLISLFG